MPRHNEKARRQFYKRLTHFQITKILGLKPRNLTKKRRYDRKRIEGNMETTVSMQKIRIRVPADKARDAQQKYDEYGMGSVEVIPTDLYGKRTSYPKGTDLKEVEKDIHEVYGH